MGFVSSSPSRRQMLTYASVLNRRRRPESANAIDATTSTISWVPAYGRRPIDKTIRLDITFRIAAWQC